jgi:hypothetical protein
MTVWIWTGAAIIVVIAALMAAQLPDDPLPVARSDI